MNRGKVNGGAEEAAAHPEWMAARHVVEYLHSATEGPASAMTALCMAMSVINATSVTLPDEEFVQQVAQSLRLLCKDAKGLS